MTDLLALFAPAAGEFLAKKAMDVAWSCITCETPKERDRIENVTYNQFYCSNCHTERRQFVNACPATVGRDGRIAAVGFSLNSKWHYIEEGFFFPARTGIEVPGHYYFDGFAGQSLIEHNEVQCHATGRLYSTDTTIWPIQQNSECCNMWLRAKFDDLPKNGKELYDLDFRIENRWGDVLLRDRDVVYI
jgi:hypothetical protein